MEAAQLILQVHRLKPGHIRPARLLQASRTLEEMGDDPDAIELLSWLREHHEPSEECSVAWPNCWSEGANSRKRRWCTGNC